MSSVYPEYSPVDICPMWSYPDASLEIFLIEKLWNMPCHSPALRHAVKTN